MSPATIIRERSLFHAEGIDTDRGPPVGVKRCAPGSGPGPPLDQRRLFLLVHLGLRQGVGRVDGWGAQHAPGRLLRLAHLARQPPLALAGLRMGTDPPLHGLLVARLEGRRGRDARGDRDAGGRVAPQRRLRHLDGLLPGRPELRDARILEERLGKAGRAPVASRFRALARVAQDRRPAPATGLCPQRSTQDHD